MPRIPFSLASGEVARDLQAGRPSTAEWAAPGIALTRAGEDIQYGSAVLAEAERRLRYSRDVLTKSEILSALEIHIDDTRRGLGTQYSGDEASRRVQASARQFLGDRLVAISDEKVRQAITAEANGKIADEVIKTRGIVDRAVITETDTRGREQVDALVRAGTPETMKEAQDLVAGLTEAGVWYGQTAQVMREAARNQSIANAFGRMVAADPVHTLSAVRNKEGIFSSLTDAEWDHYVKAAKERIDHEKNSAWTDLARKHQEMEWSRAEEKDVIDKRSDAKAKDFYQRATDPAADLVRLIREVSLSPELTEDGVRAVTGYLHSLRADQDQTDPWAFARMQKRIVDARTVSQLPSTTEIMGAAGIGGRGASQLLENVLSRRNQLENKANENENKLDHELARALRRAEVELTAITNVGGDDPVLKRRALNAHTTTLGELLRAESRKENPWDLWDKSLRKRTQGAIGSDIDLALQRIDMELGGIELEEYQARVNEGYYKGNQADADRHLALIRKREEIEDTRERIVGERKRLKGERKQAQERRETAQAKERTIELREELERPMFDNIPFQYLYGY